MNPLASPLASAWFVPCAVAAAVLVVAAHVGPPSFVRTPTHRGDVRPGRIVGATQAIARLVNRRRSHVVEPAEIADWVDELARHVRRGTTLRHAVGDVVPANDSLATATELLRRRLARGALVATAATEWHEAVEHASGPAARHLQSVATVIGVAADVGGSVAEPLDRLAAALRHAAADDQERAAQSAQARLSASVLTLVPFSMLALLLTLDSDVRSVMTTPTGAGVVAVGVALNLAGGTWMRRIIGRAP